MPPSSTYLPLALVAACGGAPLASAPPTDAPRAILLLASPAAPSATPGALASPDVPHEAVRAPAEASAACPLRGWSPGDIRGSVFVIPAASIRPALASVVESVCRCTREGDRVRVVAHIVPDRGEVTTDAPERPDIDGCLASLPTGHFPAFALESDCLDCGPRRVWPASDRPRPSSSIAYPLMVDRTGEPRP